MPRLFTLLVFGVAAVTHSAAHASVTVVANRSPATVVCWLASNGAGRESARQLTIPSGQTLPIPLGVPGQLSFDSPSQRKAYDVVPNGIYYFGETSRGEVDLGQIGLATPGDAPERQPPAEVADIVENVRPSVPPTLVIPVKILCDQDEIRSRAAWEKRLRTRVDEVSKIFKQHCFVEFRIVAVESWHADSGLSSIDESLREFEQSVDPAPARLAIGFSGQRKANYRYAHLGGTRGPLHSHLLIREWVNQNSEAERREVLVHELGHFLGAVHSPEANSVMRSVLGDRRARSAKFHIGFDPLNTLAMCLVSQELRDRPFVRFNELAPVSRDLLRRMYTDLAKATPGDPTATNYLRRLDGPHLGPPARSAP